MTRAQYRDDPYLATAPAVVVSQTPEGGIVLDRTIFYPTGGGQPGDAGRLTWTGGSFTVATTVKGDDDDIVLVPGELAPLPPAGAEVSQELDWNRRYRHMRIHTALHLLSVVIPLPVTGGAITAEKGRLDFDMPDAPGNREALEEALNDLARANLDVSEHWISERELDENPGLVKTLSVQPPRGAGRVRLIRVGPVEMPVDLQPCGGTHVATTGEIGALRIGKIEKKGARNRRVNIHFD